MSYHPDFGEFEYRPPKHSGLGLASFMIALSATAADCLVLFMKMVIDMSRPGALGRESETLMVLGTCGAWVLALVGLGLGIAGACQSNRKTVFAVIGLVFNGLILLGGGCLSLIMLLARGGF
jgi:hypothetical protein